MNGQPGTHVIKDTMMKTMEQLMKKNVLVTTDWNLALVINETVDGMKTTWKVFGFPEERAMVSVFHENELEWDLQLVETTWMTKLQQAGWTGLCFCSHKVEPFPFGEDMMQQKKLFDQFSQLVATLNPSSTGVEFKVGEEGIGYTLKADADNFAHVWVLFQGEKVQKLTTAAEAKKWATRLEEEERLFKDTLQQTADLLLDAGAKKEQEENRVHYYVYGQYLWFSLRKCRKNHQYEAVISKSPSKTGMFHSIFEEKHEMSGNTLADIQQEMRAYVQTFIRQHRLRHVFASKENLTP